MEGSPAWGRFSNLSGLAVPAPVHRTGQLHENPITQTASGRCRPAIRPAEMQLSRRLLRINAQAKAVPLRETLPPDPGLPEMTKYRLLRTTLRDC